MEINYFESGEHFGNHLGPVPSILKQFEKIEKKLHFCIFHGFWGTKCSNGMDLSPNDKGGFKKDVLIFLARPGGGQVFQNF